MFYQLRANNTCKPLPSKPGSCGGANFQFPRNRETRERNTCDLVLHLDAVSEAALHELIWRFPGSNEVIEVAIGFPVERMGQIEINLSQAEFIYGVLPLTDLRASRAIKPVRNSLRAVEASIREA